MKGFEFRPMTDADDGRPFELLRQELHQLILTVWIEGRGCLIERSKRRIC
jgi:hypothetical protein